MEEKKKRDHTTLPFLKLIFPSASVWSLCLFRSFFPPIPSRPPPFIADKPYQPQLMRTLPRFAPIPFAPLPPPRCDTTIADTCTECLPPLFKDRFLPFVFSRPKITPKVILLSPRKRTVSINWWKKLNIGEDIERREEFLHNGTSSTQSSISSRRFRKFFQ